MTKPWRGAVSADSLSLRRKRFDDRGVSPVIAVILMVAITVVLAAILYVMVSNMIPPGNIKDIGSLSFQEDENTPGLYIGMFQGSVQLDNIEISVYDSSNSMAMILSPDAENYKEIPGGLNITYEDTNENGKLDVSDQLLIFGGEPGDKIIIADKSTGQAVATHTLN